LPRAKTGHAISPGRRTPKELAKLDSLLQEAEAKSDLRTWRRATAVRSYIDGKKVIAIAEELRVCRAAVNHWLSWYEALGAEGLRSRKPPGAAPRLTEEQRNELVTMIKAGPQFCGFGGGVWTGPRIGFLIEQHFGVSYHVQHVPRLLHQLGFSVQRPRKRLARADAEAQEYWLRVRLPAIKKKRRAAEG
jgi:transposase